jgi:molybdopterin converting factor small subunit
MRVVAGQSNIDLLFDAASVTLAQVIEALIAGYPRMRPYLLDASGELQPSLRVLLNSVRPNPDATLATQLHADDRLDFLTPVAGGEQDCAIPSRGVTAC